MNHDEALLGLSKPFVSRLLTAAMNHDIGDEDEGARLLNNVAPENAPVRRSCLNIAEPGSGKSPLLLAIQTSPGDPVRLAQMVRLLNAGADALAVDAQGWTSVHMAVGSWQQRLHSQETVERIMNAVCAAGGHVHRPAVDGLTPLHLAVLNGNVEGVVSLLDERYAPTLGVAMDVSGWTALHVAAWYAKTVERVEIVRHLLAAGADPEASDANGTTPMGIARIRGNVDAVAILVANETQALRDGAVGVNASNHRPRL